MNIPEDLLYTTHDEWVRVDGDVITIGITEYAQDQLGELVHVELPAVGDAFEAGAAVAEVESVKAVAEIFTPFTGEVVEVNDELDGAAERINEDPYGSWIFRLRAADADTAELLSPAAYLDQIEG